MKTAHVIIGIVLAAAVGLGTGVATRSTATAIEVSNPPPGSFCPNGGSPVCVACLFGKTCVSACRGGYFCRGTFDPLSGARKGCWPSDSLCTSP